jgi:hypothetical protein
MLMWQQGLIYDEFALFVEPNQSTAIQIVDVS